MTSRNSFASTVGDLPLPALSRQERRAAGGRRYTSRGEEGGDKRTSELATADLLEVVARDRQRAVGVQKRGNLLASADQPFIRSH